MKTSQRLAWLAVVAAVLAAPAAKFVSVIFGNVGGNPTVCLEQKGLGNAAFGQYTFKETQVATFGCMNGGGNLPPASNKQTVSEGLSSVANLPATNGHVSGCITITASPVETPSFCPP